MSPQGESHKLPESRPLFYRSRLVFLFQILFFVCLLSYARFAQAGLFADIWKFLAGGEVEAAVESSSAAISMPLMGSQSKSQALGVGGPSSETHPPLPKVQDSALVASRNPAGTLPSISSDQILVYTVQPGDTPGGIALNFGISLNTLLWANSIRNANLIKLGDELIILPVTGVQYEVKKGDSIGSIAKKFKADEGEILSFNGLAIGESLGVGITIIIPDGELTPTSASPSTGSQLSRYANLPVEQPGYYLRPILTGRRSRGIHGFNGVDLADRCGLPVLGSAAGTVIISRSAGWNGGYGKYVVIAHANGTQTLYAHLSSILASVGQFLAQGSQIGTIGSTGNSTGCHVHFEIRGAKNPF
jgi:LysM repeat protein